MSTPIDLTPTQDLLRGLGLLPKAGDDPQKTEPGAVGTAVYDNALEVTKKTSEKVNIGGIISAVGLTGASIWAFLQEQPVVLSAALVSVAIVLAAWGLGLCWVTQTDCRCRASVATETMKARGAVTAALIQAAQRGGAVAGDTLTAMEVFEGIFQGKRVDVTTPAGLTGQVEGIEWHTGDPDIHVQLPTTSCDSKDVKAVLVH